ncbi:MAG: (d)CMP kinase [Longimicrobiales bacterium]
MIIAIDGPAASGKSSTARAVARELGFLHLDSGALYRGLTWAALRNGLDQGAWPTLNAATLDALDVALVADDQRLRLMAGGAPVGDEVRGPDVNARVSAMAGIPAVRDWVNARLRALAAGRDLVADGRDIGTVVFPDAELKIFLVADAEERARRRLADQGVVAPSSAQLEAETARLRERDRLDTERDVAPLRAAPDAVRLDTTGLDFDAQVGRVLAHARARGAPCPSEIEKSGG